jgi:broad specificity phosphatase PhoE
MTHLILIRHAQTVANAEGRWVGWGDTPLTPEGQAEVQATARRLAAEASDAVALYTSPLPRTWETAAAIGQALGLSPVPLDDLREINFGEMEGVTLEELKEHHTETYLQWRDRENVNFTWPGGERRADFFQRVSAAFDHILARHPQGTVIVVGHGGTLRAALAYLLSGEMSRWWGYSIEHCALTRLLVEGGEARLLALNDTGHLAPQAPLTTGKDFEPEQSP